MNMYEEKPVVKINAPLNQDMRAEMPQNAREFRVLLSRIKESTPAKYEKKLANGDFKVQAKKLGFDWEEVGLSVEPKAKEEPTEETKEEETEKEASVRRSRKTNT